MLFESERLIINLYLARKVCKEAKAFRQTKSIEIGDCEHFDKNGGYRLNKVEFDRNPYYVSLPSTVLLFQFQPAYRQV